MNVHGCSQTHLSLVYIYTIYYVTRTLLFEIVCDDSELAGH